MLRALDQCAECSRVTMSSMNTRPTNTQRKGCSLGVIIGALLLVAATSVGLVALASALIGPQDLSDDCECPLLEQEAASIDWLGDGRAPTEVESYAEGDDLHVNLTYSNLGDHSAATGMYEELRAQLEYWQANPAGPQGEIAGPEISLQDPADIEGGNRIIVGVTLTAPDSDAPAALSSLVDTFGIRE